MYVVYDISKAERACVLLARQFGGEEMKEKVWFESEYRTAGHVVAASAAV